MMGRSRSSASARQHRERPFPVGAPGPVLPLDKGQASTIGNVPIGRGIACGRRCRWPPGRVDRETAGIWCSLILVEKIAARTVHDFSGAAIVPRRLSTAGAQPRCSPTQRPVRTSLLRTATAPDAPAYTVRRQDRHRPEARPARLTTTASTSPSVRRRSSPSPKPASSYSSPRFDDPPTAAIFGGVCGRPPACFREIAKFDPAVPRRYRRTRPPRGALTRLASDCLFQEHGSCPPTRPSGIEARSPDQPNPCFPADSLVERARCIASPSTASQTSNASLRRAAFLFEAAPIRRFLRIAAPPAARWTSTRGPLLGGGLVRRHG